MSMKVHKAIPLFVETQPDVTFAAKRVCSVSFCCSIQKLHLPHVVLFSER